MENNYTVYCHSNNVNGKRYVGITSKHPKQRWNNGNGYRHGQRFVNAINKYGWNNFTHFILADNLTKAEAIIMETEYIAKWKCTDRKYGYNSSDGGQTVSEETKRIISAKNRGRKPAKETCENISRALKGKRCYHNMKCVEEYNPTTNNTVKIFLCIEDASKDVGVDRAIISRCCNGIQGSTKGRYFRFTEVLS